MLPYRISDKLGRGTAAGCGVGRGHLVREPPVIVLRFHFDDLIAGEAVEDALLHRAVDAFVIPRHDDVAVEVRIGHAHERTVGTPAHARAVDEHKYGLIARAPRFDRFDLPLVDEVEAAQRANTRRAVEVKPVGNRQRQQTINDGAADAPRQPRDGQGADNGNARQPLEEVARAVALRADPVGHLEDDETDGGTPQNPRPCPLAVAPEQERQVKPRE